MTFSGFVVLLVIPHSNKKKKKKQIPQENKTNASILIALSRIKHKRDCTLVRSLLF